MICNIRGRAKKLLAKGDHDILNITGVANEEAINLVDESTEDAANNRFCGVDLESPDHIAFHTQELKAMLVEAMKEGKEVDHVLSFFATAKAKDENFDYRVKRNTNGDVVGICWMTGAMRGHCHDGLVASLMLDMMKRQINSANWPYCGPVSITGENTVATLCEALVIDENFVAYDWIVKSIIAIRSPTKLY